MAGKMLIEFWEQLRGYDKWVETDATVVSFETLQQKLGRRIPTPRASRFSSDLLVWADQHDQYHFGPFVNHEGSRLFQALEGEAIPIRYDPTEPDRFCNRDYFVSWFANAAKAFAAVVIGCGFIVWRVWMIVKHRGF